MSRFIIIIVLALSIGLVGCRQPETTEPIMKVSVAQLIADYEKNESAAEIVYKGKKLIVSGEVAHYAVIRGTIGVYLKSKDLESQWSVLCLIDDESEPDAYSKLERGKDATFIGTVDREGDKKFISLTNCRFAN